MIVYTLEQRWKVGLQSSYRKCRFWKIGPFFFENEQGEAFTVNGDHYRAMLNEVLFTKFEEKDIGNI